MHRLRHLLDKDGHDWWELYEDLFLSTRSFAQANDLFRAVEGKAGRSLEDVEANHGPLRPAPEPPVFVRDFLYDRPGRPQTVDGQAFELSPGHLVFAESREEAERIFRQDGGGKADYFGRAVRREHVLNYDRVLVRELNAAPAAPFSPASCALWLDDDDRRWWEVAPGKIITAETPEGAMALYHINPKMAKSLTVEQEKYALNTPTSSELLKKLTVNGQFFDPDDDTWFLINKDGDDTDYMVMAESPDLALLRFAFDNVRAESLIFDQDELREISLTGEYSEWFDSWEDRPSTIPGGRVVLRGSGDQSDPVGGKAETAPSPEKTSPEIDPEPDDIDFDGKDAITIENEVTSGFTKPSFMPRRADKRGRGWVELASEKWHLLEEFGNSAQKAWNWFVDTDFTSGLTRQELEDRFGPTDDAGYHMMESDPVSFDVSNHTNDRQHCRCDPPFHPDKIEDEEDRRMMSKDGLWFCVTCGNLRP